MYKLFTSPIGEQYILIVSSNKYIPLDTNNKDYQEYLKWLDGYELQGREWVKTSNGNTPLPADE